MSSGRLLALLQALEQEMLRRLLRVVFATLLVIPMAVKWVIRFCPSRILVGPLKWENQFEAAVFKIDG